MKSLTIKNLEDNVVEALTAKAELEGQPVQECLRRLLARDAKMTSPIVLLERQRRAMAEGLDGAERARLLERVHPSQRSAAASRLGADTEVISLELAVLDASALLVWLGIWPSREQLAGDLLEIQFAAMLVVPSTGLLARTAHRWDERSCSWGLASAAALAEQESLPLITVSGNVDGLTVIRLA